MSVFDEINAMSAETILNKLNLPLARDGESYVCPICGNGSKGDPRHGHGDGIKPRINALGRVRWKCFHCKKDFSNFELAAASMGLNTDYDLAEAARQVGELFGLTEERQQPFSFSRARKSARRAFDSFESSPPEASGIVPLSENSNNRQSSAKESISVKDEKNPATEPELKDYTGLYKFCRSNLDKFLAECGGSYRGLTAETLKKYGVGYHPKFAAKGRDKQPHLIIPYDDNHYFARAIEGHDRSQHGNNAGLYETLPIITPTKNRFGVNIIVEGEIDALSIAQACKDYDFGCIATGGAGKSRKVVDELEKRFGNLADKPKFIVMFDNDNAGKTNGLKLVQELRAAGYPAEAFFLESGIDANDLLQKGVAVLFERLLEASERNYEKLARQAEAMAQGKERERQAVLDKSGMNIFSFADYFAADFARDINLTARYSNRKTGFENIDAAQVFMPGLYVLGALPATGKTTFAWQLLNQLAEAGEVCIYCSYEMSRSELFTKSVTRELYKRFPSYSELHNLSSVNIRRGGCFGDEYLNKQVATFARSVETNLRVAELSNTGIVELIEKLKPLCAEVDKSPVICLDYLQIVPSKESKSVSAKEKVDDIMLRLKDFQREVNATLLVISSFNRENYFQDVSFSSFKESGAIEYSADVIWGLGLEVEVDAQSGLTKKDAIIKMSKEPVRDVKLSCLKNRNGGQYDCKFRYFAQFDYFKPLKDEEEQISERPTYKK